LSEASNPSQEKKDAKAAAEVAAGNTMRAVAESYLRYEEAKPADRRLRTIGQRRSTLERLVYPTKLAGQPIGAIKRGQIVVLLDDVESKRGPRMADEVLATLRRIFDWFAVRHEDFSSPVIKNMTCTKPKERQRSRVLSDAELCKVWRVADGMGPFGSFVQFLLLTCTRRTEAAHARWSEISGDDWTIPSARYKSKHDHTIPLSGAARALLAKQPKFPQCDFIFTSDGQRPVAYSHGKRRLDELSGVVGWRLHDTRRTSRSLLSRAGISADVGERCLGHALDGLRAVYDKHTFHPEMAHAFEALAALIKRIANAPHGSSNVVPLRS
jgi:integrase